mgnify:CR=1 FL=1
MSFQTPLHRGALRVASILLAGVATPALAQAAAQRLIQAEAKLIGSVFNARKYYMPKWLYNNL